MKKNKDSKRYLKHLRSRKFSLRSLCTWKRVYKGLKIDLLTSQLEMVLQKKQSEKLESEKLIRGVSLHDSILDKEIVELVGGQGHCDDSSPTNGEGAPANPNVFNYVKGFDLHNEKRPKTN